MSTLIAYIRAEPEPLDVPRVPALWSVIVEGGRWATVFPLGRPEQPDIWFHARLVFRKAAAPQRALFVCTGRAAVLNRLAARIAADGLAWTRTWSGLVAFRADAEASVVALRAEWPDERLLDEDGDLIGLPLSIVHRHRMAGFDAEDAEV